MIKEEQDHSMISGQVLSKLDLTAQEIIHFTVLARPPPLTHLKTFSVRIQLDIFMKGTNWILNFLFSAFGNVFLRFI